MRMATVILVGLALMSVGPVAHAESELAGRWEGFQGKNRLVAVTLELNTDGTGKGEFRREGKSKVGKARVYDVVLTGDKVTYKQHYTDAIVDRVTGTTAKLELVLSPDGNKMTGLGLNIENGNTFKVELFRK